MYVGVYNRLRCIFISCCRKARYEHMEESREASPIEVKKHPEEVSEIEEESPKGFRKNPKLQNR